MNEPRIDDTRLSDLMLSTRSENVLHNAGIHTVAQLLLHTPRELLLVKGFGRRGLKEVEHTLHEYGLALPTNRPPDLDATVDAFRRFLTSVTAQMVAIGNLEGRLNRIESHLKLNVKEKS